jgi:uroporphyrinogen-III synthase
MVRMLVTRPDPEARRTAAILAELGHEAVPLPLTETVSLTIEPDTLPQDAAAVAVTSANALRHAPTALIHRLSWLPCHAVGQKTAGAARMAGFATVQTGPGDAEGLAGAVAPKLAGKSLIYLCGRVRRPVFEERLLADGIHVMPIETYDSRPIEYRDEDVSALLNGERAEIALLYSAKAAEALEALASRPALSHLFEHTQFLALSARVAESLDQKRFVRIAEEPTEASLLALLP